MIRVNVIYHFPAEQSEGAKKFFEDIQKNCILEQTRQEAGCVCYDMYFHAEDPDRIFLLELWKDQDAVASHSKEAHFLKLQEIKKAHQAETELVRFDESSALG